MLACLFAEYVWSGSLAMLCVWTSESNFRECVLSFPYVGPHDQTQVVRFGNQHAYCPASGFESNVN